MSDQHRHDNKQSLNSERAAKAREAEIDRELIASITSGNQEALAKLYDRYASLMLGVAFRILQNRGDAEDLLHDVFLEVWRQAKGYNPKRGAVRTWLLLRVRSRAIDRLRVLAKARDHAMAESINQPEAVSERDQPNHTSDRLQARQALKTLSEVQRVVVELSYFEGLTCTEIAVRCGIPVGTVKSRLFAAMEKLRHHLVSITEEAHAQRRL